MTKTEVTKESQSPAKSPISSGLEQSRKLTGKVMDGLFKYPFRYFPVVLRALFEPSQFATRRDVAVPWRDALMPWRDASMPWG